MTEAEWLAATDPMQMLKSLPEIGASHGFGFCSCCRARCRQGMGFCPCYRKLRLFTLDCCRRLQTLLPQPVCVAATIALGEYLEGEIGEAAYDDAFIAFDTTRRQRFPKHESPDDGAWNALYCSIHRRWRKEFDDNFAEQRWNTAGAVVHGATLSTGEAERQAQRHGLLDIFGNPFRPIAVDPSWLTSTVVALARGIYDERAFDRMPILADALQDADCDNEDILNHCRQPGEHVRGCWVVDLVLGKE